VLGRYSVVDIHKGRANLNYLFAQALAGFESFRMIDFAGGAAGNTITKSPDSAAFVGSSDKVFH
jgi:hypothetical protein